MAAQIAKSESLFLMRNNSDRHQQFCQLKYHKEFKVSIQSLQVEMDVIKDEFKEIKELLRQIASRNY